MLSYRDEKLEMNEPFNAKQKQKKLFGIFYSREVPVESNINRIYTFFLFCRKITSKTDGKPYQCSEDLYR